ncbi:MAG: hypothetical protein ACM3W4_10865 [Ignavibacteriales bacterium]
MAIEEITDGARDRREWDARIRLLRTIFNTYGFGALGGSLAEPLLKGAPFTEWHMAGIIVGVAAHGIALYLAPKGGPDAPVR